MRIKRGADRQAAAIELFFTEYGQRLTAHFLGEILGSEDLGAKWAR